MMYETVRVGARASKLHFVLCQNFYEAACQVTRAVREIDIARRHTPSERAPSSRQFDGRAQIDSTTRHRQAPVPRQARWFTLLCALGVDGALRRRRMKRFDGGAALSVSRRSHGASF